MSAAVCSAVPTDVERAAFQVEIMFFLMVKMSEKTCETLGNYGKNRKINEHHLFCRAFQLKCWTTKGYGKYGQQIGARRTQSCSKKNMCRLQALKFQSYCVPKKSCRMGQNIGPNHRSEPFQDLQYPIISSLKVGEQTLFQPTLINVGQTVGHLSMLFGKLPVFAGKML